MIVFLGFLDTAFGPGNNGFYVFGGTSAGAPQWAGITAIANQLSGKPLGFLNTTLYQIGKRGLLKSLMHDVTLGDNGFLGIPGYSAGPDWDLATGWGSPTESGGHSATSHPTTDRERATQASSGPRRDGAFLFWKLFARCVAPPGLQDHAADKALTQAENSRQ